MVNKFLIITTMLLLVPFLVFAGTTGKLSGVVTDQSSGDPLIGVNVIIEGTTMGASTDIDGYYVILNVPAGVYSITFNYIGYRTITYENIRVVPDITKRLDVGMEETAIELGEQIVVVADRPFFEASATNTVRVMESDEINRMPIKGVNNVVAVNAGVVVQDGSGGDLNNATINVRGGRGNETLVIVDGIPYNDAIFGNSAGSVPDAAIEQVSSQLGGFSAKYGSAQSGVINIVTKGGRADYFGSIEGVSSNITDAYNYNQVTGTFGGPLYPGNRKYDFFLSGEYIYTDDPQPRSSGVVIPSVGIDQKVRDDMTGDIIRFTGKLNSQFTTNLKATLTFNGSLRDDRQFFQSYTKNNTFHNPKIEEDVYGGALKMSQVFTETAFMDLIVRYRDQRYQRGDGYWYENRLAYGDAELNAARGYILPNNADGNIIARDEFGVFYAPGHVWNGFQRYRIQAMGADFNFTKQLKTHLIEIGGTIEQDIVRYYWTGPANYAREKESRTLEERYYAGLWSYYGYDIYGNEYNGDDTFITISNDRFEQAGPKKPIIGGFYIQDKIEFEDFILNLGARLDYFDPAFKRIKDRSRVLGADGVLTPDDFEQAPTEAYVSPRVGFAYPVTVRTVFHAQYGVFRQIPEYFDLYDSWPNLDDLESMDGQGQNLGHLTMEQTTQYEFGFKNQIGNVASLDITAYYKNIRGLVNQAMLRYNFGQTTKTVIGAENSDFGTVKGLAFAFNLRRVGPFSMKIDYTLAQSEGTGSSTDGAFVAAFRSTGNRTPKAIAPLDFDERHRITANVDIRSGKGQGPEVFGTKLFENAGANFLFTFSSGRPYTPLASVNILAGYTRYGSLTQYVNSATAAGIIRLDLRVDKRIDVGKMGIVPYLWIQNIFDRENFIDVWQSTGLPDNTAFLETPEGQQEIRSKGENGAGYAEDYKALERDPLNYGTPRTIRVGLRLEF